jgi:hypothetical protein
VIVPLEKPGTPRELVHFGVKGMHWGIRRDYQGLGRRSRTPASQAKYERRKKIAKRVAIGVGAAGLIAAGAVFIAHTLKQSGHVKPKRPSNAKIAKRIKLLKLAASLPGVPAEKKEALEGLLAIIENLPK